MIRALPIRDVAVSFGPAVVALAAAAIGLQQALVPTRSEHIVHVVAAVILGAGALMALRFARSRALLVVGWLAGLYIVLGGFAPAWVPASPVLLPSLALCTPVVLVLAGVASERGVWTVATGIRLGALAFVLAAYSRWIATRGGAVVLLAQSVVVPELGPVFGKPVTLVTVAAVLLLCGMWLRGRAPITAGFAGATLAAGVAFGVPASQAPIYLACGGLIVLVSLVETSYGLAFRDALTRLPSRRALDEDAAKLPRRFVVAMVDIDHFKKLNDRHGHDVGDQALAAVASLLSGVGGGGRAYRYGGEEFALVFPRKTVEPVLETVDALRQRIAGRRIRVRGTKAAGCALSVTVSIGVAEAGPDARRFAQVLKRADRALYKAKRGGRNQVAS